MKKLIILGYFILTLSANQIQAIEYSYSIFSTTLYNDNFNSNLEDPSGYSLNTGLTFDISTDENLEWAFNSSGIFSRQFFDLDELPPQNVKQLELEINYDAKESNLALLVRDDFSQTPQNRTSTQGVNNLTDVNIFTIRPSYFFNLTSLDRLFLEAAYVNSNRKDQSTIVADGLSFNTDSQISTVRLERKLNETSDISAVYTETDTDFDNDANSIDFVQEDLFIRWVGRGSFNQLQLEYGISEIEDEFGGNFDTELVNVIFSRQINRTHELLATYRTGFDIRLNDNSINNTTGVSDDSFGNAQKLRSANLTYMIDDTFIDLTFNIFDLEFRGAGNDTEENRSGITLSASYSLARIFSTALDTNLAFSYRKSKNEFVSSNGVAINTKTEIIEVRYNYAYNSTWSYFVSFAARNVDSNNTNVRLNGGDSNIASIGFIYTPRTIIQN